MSPVRAAVLYTALLFGANPAAADVAAADAARKGDMQKMVFAEAKPLPEVGLLTLEDGPADLGAYRGGWVVLNFWATWCPPCRHEMPSLGALQNGLGGRGLQVVTVATGRNAVPAITDFFAEAGVEHLSVLRDPKMELARSMGIAGLPVTVILNPEGQEVGRMIGDADWNGPDARAMLGALLD